MAASENLMKRCADIYRKLRNTFKFLLGNLHEFEPSRDAVGFEELEPLDQYMLARTRELTEQVLGWYEGFEFHRIYHAVNEFAIADLSAFYLDVLKDRMYTFAPSSKARRSAQTVLWTITEALTRLLAPILSFTADEVWDYLPKVEGREASVHLALFPAPEEVYPEDPAPLIEEWKRIFAIRDAVFTSLETERKQGNIGKGLEASLAIYASPSDLRLLGSLPKAALEEFFNVSEDVEIFPAVAGDAETAAEPAPLVVVHKASESGTKCERCWRYYKKGVANFGIWENVCTRCHGALTAMGVEPPAGEEVSA
jgi:isoleucyl-tRNA synthetase